MINSSELKKRLEQASEAELRTVILTVAMAAGIDRKRANAMVEDIPSLKSRLSTLSDEEFAQLMTTFGGKSNDIFKKLGLG
ncbi:MAG: hypothetical protein IJY04_08905 [Clostridia bacterium]|nr:hypothetical protein [Clostridia bacterium]